MSTSTSLPGSSLPTLYQYYTEGGIINGLSANQPQFTLNNRPINIYSGAMHYFRVPPQYWRDRLRKMRAAGLNTVETYVPWNLHEPMENVFDFGQGGTDWERFLDIPKFLKTAQREDLFVIVRPGPYICAEWEFGGFPSWLLRHSGVKLRTSDPIYMKFVTRYFNLLLSLLALWQFTRGGPIIAFQVENEYSSTQQHPIFVPDKVYMQQLWEIMIQNGIEELLLTSDGLGTNFTGTLPEYYLMTLNVDIIVPTVLHSFKAQYQPEKPLMVMEFWIGWFDHWSERHHHTRSLHSVEYSLHHVLAHNGSVNFYMFHGGTTFGFMNGANLQHTTGATVKASKAQDNSEYMPDTSSYDYDAPISENGSLTPKYHLISSIIAMHNPVKTRVPPNRKQIEQIALKDVNITGQLYFNELLQALPQSFESPELLPMEYLPMNNGSGQSYGYIVYRKTGLNLPAKSSLKIMGHVCDSVVVLVDGYPVNKPVEEEEDLDGFGYWRMRDSSIILNTHDMTDVTLDLMVENWGRVNFFKVTQMNQLKGLWQGPVLLNEEPVRDWTIYPMEFKRRWTESLQNWHPFYNLWNPGPALYVATFEIFEVATSDTFLDMTEWHKGIVIVNGFVLGRYCKLGPPRTLYLPGAFLISGTNTVLVFEHFIPAKKLTFSNTHIYVDE